MSEQIPDWTDGPTVYYDPARAELPKEPVPGPVCPDCAAGKCGICGRQPLDPVTDLVVDCACPHEALS